MADARVAVAVAEDSEDTDPTHDRIETQGDSDYGVPFFIFGPVSKSTDNKHFMAHQRGHINIDSEHVYFNRSGNWTEIEEMKLSLKPGVISSTKAKMNNGVLLALSSAVGLGTLLIYWQTRLLMVIFSGGVLMYLLRQLGRMNPPQGWVTKNAVTSVMINDDRLIWKLTTEAGNIEVTTEGIDQKGINLARELFAISTHG